MGEKEGEKERVRERERERERESVYNLILKPHEIQIMNMKQLTTITGTCK